MIDETRRWHQMIQEERQRRTRTSCGTREGQNHIASHKRHAILQFTDWKVLPAIIQLIKYRISIAITAIVSDMEAHCKHAAMDADAMQVDNEVDAPNFESTRLIAK